MFIPHFRAYSGASTKRCATRIISASSQGCIFIRGPALSQVQRSRRLAQVYSFAVATTELIPAGLMEAGGQRDDNNEKRRRWRFYPDDATTVIAAASRAYSSIRRLAIPAIVLPASPPAPSSRSFIHPCLPFACDAFSPARVPYPSLEVSRGSRVARAQYWTFAS